MVSPEHPEERQLHEYLDGALAEAERARLAAHLAGCAACSERLWAARRLFALLAELPEAPLARDLTPGVLAAVGDPAPSRSRQPVLAALAVLELAAALGLI